MKVVLLAGGLGTRISEESHLRPKPMIEIGEMPILWHIMKHFSYYGHNEFIICAGYKQHVIKEWFADYFLHTSDVTFDFTNGSNELIIHNHVAEPWKVTIVDTGLHTMTGGRIKRIRDYVGNEPFFMTYGDGVSNVDLDALLSFHKEQKSLCTLTAVQPEARFGALDINAGRVEAFREKAQADMAWVNAGFMVVEPEVFDYIAGDEIMFEKEPLERLACEQRLTCYQHNGFWQCMDTLRDKQKLEDLWAKDTAPWKVW